MSNQWMRNTISQLFFTCNNLQAASISHHKILWILLYQLCKNICSCYDNKGFKRIHFIEKKLIKKKLNFMFIIQITCSTNKFGSLPRQRVPYPSHKSSHAPQAVRYQTKNIL